MLNAWFFSAMKRWRWNPLANCYCTYYIHILQMTSTYRRIQQWFDILIYVDVCCGFPFNKTFMLFERAILNYRNQHLNALKMFARLLLVSKWKKAQSIVQTILSMRLIGERIENENWEQVKACTEQLNRKISERKLNILCTGVSRTTINLRFLTIDRLYFNNFYPIGTSFIWLNS